MELDSNFWLSFKVRLWGTVFVWMEEKAGCSEAVFGLTGWVPGACLVLASFYLLQMWTQPHPGFGSKIVCSYFLKMGNISSPVFH